MYERRLKIFFGVLIGATLVLLLRCAQLQIVRTEEFQEKAARSMRRPELLETTRGRILDIRGVELARDEPCLVASVDYRAIERNADWIREQAIRRLGQEYRRADRQRRRELLEWQTQQVHRDLDRMWVALAEVSGKTLEEIEQIKAAIRRRVLVRYRYVWYMRYAEAHEEHEQGEPPPWFRRFLLSGEGAPDIDSFEVEIAEQAQPHVILSDLSTETHNWLAKQLERFPGLVLERSKHRVYPLGESACHLLGHLSIFTDEDDDPHPQDQLRRYFPNDLIGRGGIEQLCEPALRGVRGLREWSAVDHRLLSMTSPVPGQDVRLTIDSELQRQIEQAFGDVRWIEEGVLKEQHEMHGAAVVIDVPTGQVRALVSYPTYDLNRYAELYPVLCNDQINRPFLNRATQLHCEPGSTVKPIVGIGAITQGLIGADQGIECTGYLVLHGKRYEGVGRCWTASKFARDYPGQVAHHQIPTHDPHPTGHLVFSDALQRSCNVYFETLGDRLGIDGLSYWFRQFGLGRRTGIGIGESAGYVPDDFGGEGPIPPSVRWFASIGQTQIGATPLQMANVAATIARNGVRVRPRLLADESVECRRPTSEKGDVIPEREVLKLSPAALAAARDGMIRVINSPAGTGRGLHDEQIVVAGKTGTAQVMPMKLIRYDENRRPMRDARGRLIRDVPRISTRGNPNPQMRWYRGTGRNGDELSHAWFIGFAPADDPQIAFAVLLEYGGSGGSDAGVVAKALLEACKQHGYLRSGK